MQPETRQISPAHEASQAKKPAAPGNLSSRRNGSNGSATADLVHSAQERMRRGFSPPAEIYLVQNRAKIDWSRYPDWARPVDPELFGDSCHEG
jgi:hypothetical protein